MVEIGWCRRRLNKQVRRVKRVFRWGVARNLVPPEVAEKVEALEAVRKGESGARETDRRRPVPDTAVAATLPFLRPPVAAIVRLLRLTGARSAEICALTLGRIDRSGAVWAYTPSWHKGAQADRDRVTFLGPKAQAVLSGFLQGRVPGPDEAIFSPIRDREARFAEWRARRKSKVPPSQRDRRKAEPARRPGAWYTPVALAHAVANAVAKANARRARLAAGAAFDPVPGWSPYQLRHARGTEVRRLYGVEHAGAVLGHSRLSATETYTHTDLSRAARVAGEVG
jgi:integrase